ncbi:MAG: MAPEG family protein [Halopseudomonas sp.]|uniref:MAPEG family protein n=1 Tax=Halopseudomonas sp. TaxID=2901191 RepID=UPI003002715A
MNTQLLLLSLLVQIALTLYLYIKLGGAKRRALEQGQVNQARRALHDDAWPDSVRQINNNIRNQFELPVLFYVLVLVLLHLGATGWLAPVLAWLFVLSRLAHAWVHTGSNQVPLRRRLFTFGCVIILLMTALAAWQVLAR